MPMLMHMVRLLRTLLALVVLTGLAAGPARADLGGNVTITLLAPGGLVVDSTPLSFSDLVGPGDGLKLAAGDGSNIGSFMLPQESIAFLGNSLRLRVAAGDVVGGALVTGYLGSGGSHARYEFGGLAIAGQKIVGLAFSDKDGYLDSGFSGLLSPASPSDYVRLIDAQRLSVDLDSLVFKDRGQGQSANYLELRIDLLTQPVPEPAGYALLIAGGLLLVWRLHRAAH